MWFHRTDAYTECMYSSSFGRSRYLRLRSYRNWENCSFYASYTWKVVIQTAKKVGYTCFNFGANQRTCDTGITKFIFVLLMDILFVLYDLFYQCFKVFQVSRRLSQFSSVDLCLCTGWSCLTYHFFVCFNLNWKLFLSIVKIFLKITIILLCWMKQFIQ